MVTCLGPSGREAHIKPRGFRLSLAAQFHDPEDRGQNQGKGAVDEEVPATFWRAWHDHPSWADWKLGKSRESVTTHDTSIDAAQVHSTSTGALTRRFADRITNHGSAASPLTSGRPRDHAGTPCLQGAPKFFWVRQLDQLLHTGLSLRMA
ncbi:hypothetical protein V2G26_011488 [Clonostachys chloroleuca]